MNSISTLSNFPIVQLLNFYNKSVLRKLCFFFLAILMVKADAQVAPAPAGYTCENTIFSEYFESGIPAGWEVKTIDYRGPLQVYSPSLEGWFVHTGPTSSMGTGPSHAYEGDYYAYCEGSGPVDRLEVATLTTPSFRLYDNGKLSLSFYLNMYGPSTSLAINVIEGMTKINVLAPVSGNIHTLDQWEQIYLDLSAFNGKSIRIEFEAVKPASGQNGDIAFDQVEVCHAASPVVAIPSTGQWSLGILFCTLLLVAAYVLNKINGL